jgi:hypothetical protein
MESSKKKSEGLVFSPRGTRDLRVYHPELSTVDEFKPLTAVELRFVWCFSVLYLDVKNFKDRITKSVVDSYGKNIDEWDLNKLINNEIPIKLERAIEKMISFDPTPRLKARYITERIFSAYNTIVDIDVKEAFTVRKKTLDGTLIEEEMDWGKLSQFVNATSKITEAIPKMIEELEQGYGFGKSKESDQDRDVGLAEEFMNGQ